MFEAVATLVAGGVIGYLGQRSRMCSVGGLRDWLLVRDTELLTGLVTFVVSAWLGFSLLASMDLIKVRPLGGSVAQVDDLSIQTTISTFVGQLAASPLTVVIAVTAAAAMGFLSVQADGCPFRQHVRAGQGDSRAWSYLSGFYIGVLVAGPVIVLLAPKAGSGT